MRAALPLAILLSACAGPVRDLPADRAPARGQAMLAGRLAFSGSRIAPSIGLRSQGGSYVRIQPAHEHFLVAVPPGTYVVERFGEHYLTDDQLVLEAHADAAAYIGSFHAARDERGNLRVAVRDEPEATRAALARRYGEAMPVLVGALVRSSLAPLPGAEGELVVAVKKQPSYSTHTTFHFGIGYGYYYGHHHGHHRSHHRRRYR